MSSKTKIEEFLNRFAEGDLSTYSSFLQSIANEPVYIPMISSNDGGGESETKRVRVATFPSKGRKYVPAFTSEEFFFNWSDLRFQSFAVFAGDLSVTLPQGTWILLNPGRYNSLELSPEDLDVMAAVEPGIAEQDTENETSYVESGAANLASEVYESAQPPSVPEHDAVQGEFVEALRPFLAGLSGIQEGYFLPTPGNSTQGAIGILARDLGVESRFRLIAHVAELSKKYFSYAGAVDLYDDLQNQNSNSWEMFKTITPFYTREDRISGGDALSHEVEKFSQPKKIEAQGSSPKQTGKPQGPAAKFLGGIRPNRPRF